MTRDRNSAGCIGRSAPAIGSNPVSILGMAEYHPNDAQPKLASEGRNDSDQEAKAP
jgi:hypothetical protein